MEGQTIGRGGDQAGGKGGGGVRKVGLVVMFDM